MNPFNTHEDAMIDPVAFCGVHRLANGVTVFVTSAHLPREGSPSPVKFSDGTVYAPSRAEAERIALLAKRLKVEGLDGENAVVVHRDAHGTRFARVTLRLSQEALAILDALDAAARLINGIVWVSLPIVSAIREMGMQGRYQRVAAMISTPETRRVALQDKVVLADTWSVP
jgi:hypothetical protein